MRLFVMLFTLCISLLPVVPGSRVEAGEGAGTVLFREEFADLGNWEPFLFPKNKKHTVYTIAQEEGRHYLKAESDGSASAIVYKSSFNVSDFPKARWRWK